MNSTLYNRYASNLLPEFAARKANGSAPLGSTGFNKLQQAAAISLKRKHLKTGYFRLRPETALGAGGRAFKSPRPDHENKRLIAIPRIAPCSSWVALRGGFSLAATLLSSAARTRRECFEGRSHGVRKSCMHVKRHSWSGMPELDRA